MIRKGEKHGSLKLLNFYDNFSGSTANSASLSNRAPSSSASDDFPLSSAFMSRDSGIHLCLYSITSRYLRFIVLKLFLIRWSQNARTKVDTFVEFPLSGLDMSSYLIRNLSSTRYSNANSCLYDLAAVIVHHGNGMGSGKSQ